MVLFAALTGCSFDRTPITERRDFLGSSGRTGASGAGGAGAAAGGAAGAALLGAGSPAAGAGGASGASGAAGAEPAAGSSGGAGGTPALPGVDAAVATPDAGPDTVPDAGVVDAGDVADTGTPAVDAGGQDPVAPQPGELFARCTRDVGCGEGLICYGTLPGYCAQACQQSDECVDHGGIDFTCSSTHFACRVDCDPDDGPDACPAPLSCEEVDGVHRCRYPLEEGSFDRGRFEPCDLAHGDDDCADGRLCYRSSDSAFDGPGYCTDGCAFGGTCEQDVVSAAYECSGGSSCRLVCDGDGDCPAGMACEQTDEGGRCHYPP